MDTKKLIIAELLKQLASQLEAMALAAKTSSQAASHPDNKAENRQDTRATLDGYLASAQSKLAGNIERQMDLLRRLTLRNFSPQDPIAAGAMIELRANNLPPKTYFLLPDCGGQTLMIEGETIYVISSQSPIGEVLIGQLAGETVEVETPQGRLDYEISLVQ